MVFNLLPWRRRSRAYSYSFSYARTRFEKSQKASMRKSMSFLLQQSNNFRLAIERSRHG